MFDEGVKNWCGSQQNSSGISQGKKDVGIKARRECEKFIEAKTPLLTYNIFDGDTVPPGDYPHMVRDNGLTLSLPIQQNIYKFCV